MNQATFKWDGMAFYADGANWVASGKCAEVVVLANGGEFTAVAVLDLFDFHGSPFATACGALEALRAEHTEHYAAAREEIIKDQEANQ